METKHLYKSREGRVLAGVCGGVAEYFEVDPTLVRLIFVALCFLLGTGVLAYLVAMLIIPNAPMQ